MKTHFGLPLMVYWNSHVLLRRPLNVYGGYRSVTRCLSWENMISWKLNRIFHTIWACYFPTQWFALPSEAQRNLERWSRTEARLQFCPVPSSPLSHTETHTQPLSICTGRHLSWESCTHQPPSSVQVRVLHTRWHHHCLSVTESCGPPVSTQTSAMPIKCLQHLKPKHYRWTRTRCSDTEHRETHFTWAPFVCCAVMCWVAGCL